MISFSLYRLISLGIKSFFIGHSDDELLLNTIFNSDTPIKKVHYPYSGDILLSGEADMTEIAEKYGLVITSKEQLLTLGDFL